MTDFLGTSDTNDLVLKTSDKEKMRINSNGKIVIGTNPDPNVVLNFVGSTEFFTNETALDGFHFFSGGLNKNTGTDLMWLSYNNYQPNDVCMPTLSAPPTLSNLFYGYY